MSLEVVRLLSKSGAPPEVLATLLFQATEKRIPLTAAIAELHPELLPILEREVERDGLATLEMVRPDMQLYVLLPEGLCERLGVLPVLRDARSGQVEAAALDAFDSHALAELAHHLGASVNVRLASPEAFRLGLERARRGQSGRASAPAASEPPPAPAAPRQPSQPPSQPRPQEPDSRTWRPQPRPQPPAGGCPG